MFTLPNVEEDVAKLSGDGETSGVVRSPMPGVVEKVMVSPGASVKAGDPLIVVIAMKMEVSLCVNFSYSTLLNIIFESKQTM